jgi:hypothetical protein
VIGKPKRLRPPSPGPYSFGQACRLWRLYPSWIKSLHSQPVSCIFLSLQPRNVIYYPWHNQGTTRDDDGTSQDSPGGLSGARRAQEARCQGAEDGVRRRGLRGWRLPRRRNVGSGRSRLLHLTGGREAVPTSTDVATLRPMSSAKYITETGRHDERKAGRFPIVLSGRTQFQSTQKCAFVVVQIRPFCNPKLPLQGDGKEEADAPDQHQDKGYDQPTLIRASWPALRLATLAY